MSATPTAFPPIVSATEWQRTHAAFLAKEKDFTRARDALAAERRRLPMVKIDKDYVFAATGGPISLLELFEGRSQLLLYHFMFASDVRGWPEAGCPGCSMFLDNIGQFAPVHLKARGLSLAVVSRAPLTNIETYRKRMSWPHRWVSSADNSFNVDLGLTVPGEERHGLSVFLLKDGDIYRTYFTAHRGSEGLGNVWGFLDSSPYGRQETWEKSPAGWPQTPPYQWWRRHDEY